MDKGYVYIARIIDHGGKFVNGYHKIGLSKQYKIRQTQLNSTHLPFDVLMVRVFETEEMSKIESLLHLCFEDYRVVKEYDFRKNITTEWFDVSDIDVFNERVDKFSNLMGITEIDMFEGIDKDSSLNDEEKAIEKQRVGVAKASKVVLKIGDQVYQDDTQKSIMAIAYKYICQKVGFEKVVELDRLLRWKMDEFKDYVESSYRGKNMTVEQATEIIDIDGAFLWTGVSAKSKKRHINRLQKTFNLDELSFEIV